MAMNGDDRASACVEQVSGVGDRQPVGLGGHDHAEQPDVAGRGQAADDRLGQGPAHRGPHLLRLVERLIPGRVAVVVRGPVAPGHGLDQPQGDAA